MDNESTGFRIYFPERRIVNVERKVVFDRSKGDDSITIDIEATPAPSEINDKIHENPLEPEIVPLEDEPKEELLGPRRAKVKAPGFYDSLHGNVCRAPKFADFTQYALASALETGPATLKQALAGLNSNKWQKAWDEELGQLVARKTWEIVDRPSDKPVIPHLVVLREKTWSSWRHNPPESKTRSRRS
jgi:hypothetical protein